MIPVGAVFFIGTLGAFAFLTYRLTHPGAIQEAIDPSHFFLPAVDVYWSSSDGVQVAGWWIPGKSGAPGIVLAPGYGMSRASSLSLAAVLNQEGYHILTYDARGSGAVPRGASSLGIHEAEDMLDALNYIRSRPGVNRGCLGIWGVDVNARAAIKAAISRPEVCAVVADSAYDSVVEFIAVRVHEDFGWENEILASGCRQMFRLYMLASESTLWERLPTAALGDRKVLFIEGENRKELARLTVALYDRVQAKKQLISIPVSRTRLMSGENIKSYDRQVSDFFHLNLH